MSVSREMRTVNYMHTVLVIANGGRAYVHAVQSCKKNAVTRIRTWVITATT